MLFRSHKLRAVKKVIKDWKSSNFEKSQGNIKDIEAQLNNLDIISETRQLNLVERAKRGKLWLGLWKAY